MEKEEIRAVIKYFNIKGLTPAEIKSEMEPSLGDSPQFLTIICKWSNEFKSDNTSTKDAVRADRPKTATSEEIVEKVRQVVLADRRLRLIEIAKASGISEDRVHHII